MTLPKIKNDHARVLHTLINPPKELCYRHWMKKYNSYKFSTRLGELERKLGYALVNRDEKGYIIDENGKKKDHVIYKPILTVEKYLELYTKINVK